MSLLRIKKPTTRKGKKYLLERAPKILENPKATIFIEGRKCAGAIKQTLKDLYQLKKPLCKVLTRNNDISPFEDATPLENLARKKDCSLFMFGSTSKKRPDNLILGRLYEHELLDMVELGINSFKSLNEFHNEKIGTCVKPCIIFNGPKWKQTEELRRLKSLLLDAFQREKIERIRLQGIEHVLSFTASEDMTVYMRSYKILLKKSGQKTPRIELSEIGPAMNFSIRRTKIASESLFKQASKQPKQLKVRRKKNITLDGLGNKHGRVHVGRQNVTSIQTRKMKGLKKTAEERRADRQRKKAELRKNNVVNTTNDTE